MANDTSRRPWSLDTAAVITTDRVRVESLHWVGGTTAGHVCRIEDNNGERVWEAVATAANFDKESVFDGDAGAFDGFELAEIGSGILYVRYS